MDELMEKQSRQRNEQREFEEFLYRHVKRLLVVYTGVSLTFWLLAAACVVMFIAALMMHLPLLKGLLLLVFGGGAVISAITFRQVAWNHREAEDEMAYGLEHPECNVPDDYEDNTKDIRNGACVTLKSVRSLIFAYSFIALMLWAATPIMFMAAGMGGGFGFSPGLFAVSFVLPAMAIPLTALAVSYMIGYRETKHFMPRIIETVESIKKK